MTEWAISEEWSLTWNSQVGKVLISYNAKESRFTHRAGAAVLLHSSALSAMYSNNKSMEWYLGALQLSRMAKGMSLFCFQLCWLEKLLLPIAYHSIFARGVGPPDPSELRDLPK